MKPGSKVDHVTTYIFGSVSKRRSTQQSLLKVSAPVNDDSLSLSSRRSSTCASTTKRGSAISSVHSGSSARGSSLTPEPVDPVNGHSGSSREDSGDERSNAVSQAAASAAASARFTCPLCKRQLSEPRVLPCLHSFCTACLRELDSVPADAAGTSQVALWNGENEVAYPGGRSAQNPEEQNGGGGSSAGSGYESEEPAREAVWSPLSTRRNAAPWVRRVALTTSSSNQVNSAANGSRIIVCPTCGTEARIPAGGVLMFPLHHVLQHRMLLASLARDAAGAAGQVFCDLCSTDVHATCRCSDCLLSLCTFCSEAHQRQRRTAAHEVLPLQEARRRGTRILRQQLCPAHPGQEMRFFCESCGQVACRDCCVTLHRDHRPPCEPVSRVAASYISATRDAVERARPLAEGVRAAFDRLQLLEQRIQNKASNVQEEVDNHMDAWMEALEEHRRALTLQVRKARESKLQAIRAQQMELERRSGDVSSAVRFADELLSEGSEVEVMSTVSPLLRRLEWCVAGGSAVGGNTVNGSTSSSSSSAGASSAEHVSTVPGMPTITRVSDYLRFLPTEVSGRTAEGLPLYGVVTTQSCSASHCRLDMDALSTCRQHRRVEVLLITRDGENQPIGHGGADVNVDVRTRDPTRRPLAIQVNDRGDGTYLISFLPDTAGNYIMTVFVQNKPIHGSPFHLYVRPLRPHSGIYHCCTFCSSNGSKEISCGCGGKMPGGYRGCGHGHTGHPGRRHWSCCGSVLESSECGRGNSSSVYQFPHL